MTDIILSICLGIGLAASAGFRVFIPLLFASIAAYLDIIPLHESWQWAGSITAVIVLGVAAVVELLAYYIPYIDNLLDTISVPLAAIAGTAVMVSVMGDLNPVITWSLAVIAGGGTAAAISTTTPAVRASSTATTGGLGNPVVSTIEAGFSSVLSVLSIAFAPLAVIVVFFLLIGIRKLYKKLFKKKKEAVAD
jgi:Kef-type K+ transport system membrane component KefB